MLMMPLLMKQGEILEEHTTAFSKHSVKSYKFVKFVISLVRIRD